MRISEILDLDKTADLKDLSKHNHHGRVWVDDQQRGAVLDAIYAVVGSDDVPVWYDWLNPQETVYEVSFTSTSKTKIMDMLAEVKKAVPRARKFYAYSTGALITHDMWTEVN